MVEGDETGAGEERGWQRSVASNDNRCPICGAPGGKYSCKECGWCSDDAKPVFSDSLDDPVSTITKAKQSYMQMKRENNDLRQRLKTIMLNNNKFSELVEAMEKEIERIRSVKDETYAYNYGEGGWGEVDEADKDSIHLKEKEVTFEDINNQLMEIMRLLKKYKK